MSRAEQVIFILLGWYFGVVALVVGIAAWKIFL